IVARAPCWPTSTDSCETTDARTPRLFSHDEQVNQKQSPIRKTESMKPARGALMASQQCDQQSGATQQAIEAGAEPHLRRALGAWGASAFVVTSMIGTGIFTVPAFVRTATGNGVAAL